MIERATGLVLRTRPLTETSLIVHWLTPELGRVATVAKGARRPKSPFRGKLDLFYSAAFSFQRSRRSSLHTLREVMLQSPHVALRTDFAKLRQATYAALLIEQVTEEETPLPELHALLGELLDILEANPARPEFLLAFEFKLLALSGLAAGGSTRRLSRAASALAESLTARSLAETAGSPARPAELAGLAQFLHGFMIYHLGRIPSGRDRALGG
ncbi:MAG: DNA repair protein RecO [Verrucomicrobiota bacterium]|jgi:DNA repair protein RecO (recombination protein O)